MSETTGSSLSTSSSQDRRINRAMVIKREEQAVIHQEALKAQGERWRERMKGFCAAAREKVEAAEGKVDKTAKMNRQLLVALKRSKEKEKRLEKEKKRIEEELAQLSSQLKNSQESLLFLQEELQKKTEALENEEIEEKEKEDEVASLLEDVTPIKATGLFLSVVGIAGLGMWFWK